MPHLTQIVNFELSPDCNLGEAHCAKCPNTSPERRAAGTSTTLSDATILRTAEALYREHGFGGLIGWHYYSEPLMQAERMFRLMRELRQRVPESRFLLWSNGALLPEVDGDWDPYRLFAAAVITDYGIEGVAEKVERLRGMVSVVNFPRASLDERMNFARFLYHRVCLRPFLEINVDCWANVHLCCYDWRGKARMGNLVLTALPEVIDHWRKVRDALATVPYGEAAPRACRSCGARFYGNATGFVPEFVVGPAREAVIYLKNKGVFEV